MTRLTRLMTQLRAEFGDHCALCAADDDLEFAHIEPTGVNGRGRGGLTRAYNIRNNKRCFRLLCTRCHRAYDAFLRNAQRVARERTTRWYLGQRIEGDES